jgi:diadenosine tetraphosphate (Ap4A) HIT family hydrolase
MRISPLVAAFAFVAVSSADVRTCLCDLSQGEARTARECSLCQLADSQPADPPYFFVKDANPNKPNRMLALPRSHGRNPQDLSGMTADERTAYWTVTIDKARELWSDHWGLAINSLERRTQCHMHIHIGKLRDGVENDSFTVVDSASSIPLPREGDGLLVHPAGGKLHVHTGNDAPELLLER